tara:strand:- start:1957 stop:2190 length:234 start_codon:yes stop_codon:yes gene_type:complete
LITDLNSDLLEVVVCARGMAKGATATALVSTGGTSNSLRTTIPMWIVEQFGLSAGSKIEWSLEVKDGEMSISVSPQE